jgi:hypothetical protein
VIGLSDGQSPVHSCCQQVGTISSVDHRLTPNESDPLALRRGVYDAVESCRLWLDVDEAGESLDGDTLLDSDWNGSAPCVSRRIVLSRLSRSFSGMDTVSGLKVQLSVCLEGVLGSPSNGGAPVGVYLILGEIDLIMIVLEE